MKVGFEIDDWVMVNGRAKWFGWNPCSSKATSYFRVVGFGSVSGNFNDGNGVFILLAVPWDSQYKAGEFSHHIYQYLTKDHDTKVNRVDFKDILKVKCKYC